jgi:hypothetical protein
MRKIQDLGLYPEKQNKGSIQKNRTKGYARERLKGRAGLK